MSPVLLVIAGPNGAGKTTITGRLKNERWSAGAEYLNPDEVAQQRFGDWNSPDAIMKAMKWTEARREELLSLGHSFAFETVLSSPGKVEFLTRAKASGYFVRCFFIGTENPKINAARVATRVMQGGHTVPIEKIVSRYARSMANLGAVIPLCDRVYLYDNSLEGVEARLCARTEGGAIRKVYGSLPTWVETAVTGLAHHANFEDHLGRAGAGAA